MTPDGELILGKYRILARLGEGGMGTVYRARDEMLDRDVAIKLLRQDLSSQAHLVERFRAEAIALARLAHPRIATLHGLERDGEQFYMIMEFLRGETLETLIQRDGPMPWQQAVAVCAAICDALSHAHAHGVVHRDIKPANVMLGPDHSVKVMDFGIARMMGSSRQTRHGNTIGTPSYMAPEQLRGEDTDGRTDLYALGTMLYELLSGKVPFSADSDYQLMMMQLNDPVPLPSRSAPGVPSSIDAIVIRAMSKRASDRYSDASAMREALEQVLRGAPVAPRTSGPRAIFAAAAAMLRPTAEPATYSAENDPPFWQDWRSWLTVSALGAAVVLIGVTVWPAAEPRVPDTSPPAPEIAINPVPEEQRSVTRDQTNPVRGITSDGPVVPPQAPPAAPPRNTTPQPPPVNPRPTPAPPPPPPPPSPPNRRDPTPQPEQPVRDPAADRRAVASVVSSWLGAASGGAGIDAVDADALKTLVREKRITISPGDVSGISVQDGRATASSTAGLRIRSAFGGTKQATGQFQFDLVPQGSSWRVSRVRMLNPEVLR